MTGKLATHIEHLGHTSFAVTRGNFRLLIDSILVRRELDFGVPTWPQWFYNDLDAVDAVFLSHSHEDHLHPPSMLGLPENVPIFFLESCKTTRKTLTNLGFENLHPFSPGDAVQLLEDIVVHIIPAEPSLEGTVQCCFLINTPDVLMLDAVDILDSTLTREALEAYRGSIDLAFVPAGISLQQQGFWNQMDPVQAVVFCQWLEPAKVAPNGGTVSMARKPQLGRVERYPSGLGNWLSIASRHLRPDQLLRASPPCRLEYESHQLRRCGPFYPASTFQPRGSAPRTSALVTTVFTGYNPQLPTRKLAARGSFDVSSWGLVKEVMQNSKAEIQYLLERCEPSVNCTPTAMLAPCTIRHLLKNQAFDLASLLTVSFPTDASADLEFSFFGLAEALLANAWDLTDSLATELQACLWIDRRLLQLKNAQLQLAKLAGIPQEGGEEALAQHTEDLWRTLQYRRPVLGSNHLRLSTQMIPLLDGVVGQLPQNLSEVADCLCSPSPSGIQVAYLPKLDSELLDLCDGRTFPEIVEEYCDRVPMPKVEVEEALFNLLLQLTRASVIVNWSSEWA